MTDREQYVPVDIVIAEDDPEDRLITEKAFRRDRLINKLRFVEDGRALADYLSIKNGPAQSMAVPRSMLILLDLYMPKTSGLEFLWNRHTEAGPAPGPILVLTGSEYAEDVADSYNLGAEGYLVKPVSLAKLHEAVAELDSYALRVVGGGGTTEQAAPAELAVLSAGPADRPTLSDELINLRLANEVTAMDSGQELLETLRSLPPGGTALALVDADALTTAERQTVTELGQQSTRPVVLVTSELEPGSDLPAGAQAKLPRPLTLTSLCEALRTLDGLSFELVTLRES